jgi:acyl-CoA thioester hydrolase
MTGLPFDPSRARTTVRLRVRFCDTDLMGIVHHANYLEYFEVGRVEWLRRRGVSYSSWAERGLHLPVIETRIRYRAPAKFDDELDVETSLGELRIASLRFDYRVTRPADPTPTLVCEGSTTLACVNDAHAIRRFTEEMIAVLTAPEST